MEAQTQMYNVKVNFDDKGTHVIGIEGSDEDDALQAMVGVLRNMTDGEYSILSINVDSEFNVKEERLKARRKREAQERFQTAGTEFAEFVKGKEEKHYLVLEDDEFVIKRDDEQIHGQIAAVYDPAQA